MSHGDMYYGEKLSWGAGVGVLGDGGGGFFKGDSWGGSD